MTDNEKYLQEELNYTKQNIQNLSDEDILDTFFWTRIEQKAYLDRDDSIPWTQLAENIVSERVRVIEQEILHRMNKEN